MIRPRPIAPNPHPNIYLLDGGKQAVGVSAHDRIKLAPLRFIQLAALKGLEVKPDTSDRGLQFVRHGVEKRVLSLVSPYLAYEENCVHNHSCHQQGEEDHAEDQQRNVGFVGQNPPDVQRNRKPCEQRPKRDGCCDGSASSGDVHKGCGMLSVRLGAASRDRVQRHKEKPSTRVGADGK